MNVLVTGANGLLGANLVRALLRDKHRVRVLVREKSDTRGLHGLDVERVVGDVREPRPVRAAVDGCELVFHAAAVFSYWGYSREEMMDTVREGTGIMVEACRDAGVRRIVLTSSTSVLGGNTSPEPLSEDAPLNEDGPDYFQSKAVQERLAVQMAKELGVDLAVVNPAVFVGPNDFRPSQSAQTFTGFLRDPFKLSYPGGLSLVHVEDVARGHLIAAQQARPYERHILAGENLRWGEFHEMLAVLTDGPGPRIRVNRSVAYAAAAIMELVAAIIRRPPPATRALASQVGRFFWYRSDKMRRLGYSPRAAKSTLRDTLTWWTKSPHVSRREREAWTPRL